MTIGELARSAGVGIETIRYYERTGLIAKSSRNAVGHRIYSDRDVRQLRFIKRAQAHGFSLKSIARLLSHRASSDCSSTCRAEALSRIEEIEHKILGLESLKKALANLVVGCGRLNLSK